MRSCGGQSLRASLISLVAICVALSVTGCCSSSSWASRAVKIGAQATPTNGADSATLRFYGFRTGRYASAGGFLIEKLASSSLAITAGDQNIYNVNWRIDPAGCHGKIVRLETGEWICILRLSRSAIRYISASGFPAQLVDEQNITIAHVVIPAAGWELDFQQHQSVAVSGEEFSKLRLAMQALVKDELSIAQNDSCRRVISKSEYNEERSILVNLLPGIPGTQSR